MRVYKRTPARERFWRRVEKAEGCWLWQGHVGENGYGLFRDEAGKTISAHRFAYMDTHGAIPEGLVVMHTCDNPPCVRPDHLRVGTFLDNTRDSQAKRRRAIGERHGMAKLTDQQCEEIRNFYEPRWVTAEMLSGFYPASVVQIRKIAKGRARRPSGL